MNNEETNIIKKWLGKESIQLSDTKFFLEEYNELSKIEKYSKLATKKFIGKRDVGNVGKTFK